MSTPNRDESPATAVVHRVEGNFLEDFHVGDVYQHPLGRTITEVDNSWFTPLSPT
jgi:itaconyl-CoA hydratase